MTQPAPCAWRRYVDGLVGTADAMGIPLCISVAALDASGAIVDVEHRYTGGSLAAFAPGLTLDLPDGAGTNATIIISAFALGAEAACSVLNTTTGERLSGATTYREPAAGWR